MELQGKVIAVLPERSGVSARGEWKAQSFVIETHEQYPKKLCFDVFGADRLAQFNIQSGEEIPEGSDILFLTNAAYIQNFDKTPTAKSANPDLIIQCIEEKKRHNSVGVKIVQYHKSPLLIETHDRATEVMAKTRKEFHQKNK